ncbi:MAG: hypothetical protein ACRD50_17400 [Candidatus Acidiferrales bacterium]
MPLVPPLAEFKAIETRVVEAGADAIMAMWAKLGLSFTETPPDGLAIHVTEPIRD